MPMQTVLNYLRVFRAQTFPASLLLVMFALLAPGGKVSLWMVAVLFPLVWLIHAIGFGLNSYLDTVAGYDREDPAKAAHPLVSRKISMGQACRVLNFLAMITVVFAALVSLQAREPTLALFAFLLYAVFGYAYNCHLGKEDFLLGPVSISLSFTGLAAWAWFISHETIGLLGWVLILYVFFTILFQISVSGSIKEMQVKERSNLLIRLGAKLRGGKFEPSNSIYYGWTVKIINLFLGVILLYLVFTPQGLISLLFFGSVALYFLHQLTKRRVYERNRELRNMSAMEIATIFLPLAIVVPLVPALALMVFSLAYFVVANTLLWQTRLAPRV